MASRLADVMNLITRTADGVFAIDSGDRIVLWNRSAEEILGFAPREVLGKFCYEVLPGRDPSGNLFCFRGCSVATMAKSGQLVRNYDVQMPTKAGNRVWLNVSILVIPVPRQNGPIIIHLFRHSEGPARIQALAEQMASSVAATLCMESRLVSVGNGAHSATAEAASLLTRRETEILMLLAKCMGTKEITHRLCISGATVRTHIQHIFEKLQVHTKLEAVISAFQKNLIPNDNTVASPSSGKPSTAI